jgi:hypothetical protein
VDLERISPRTFVFRQGAKLVVSTLPGLRADEVGMTSDRARATREGELDFLTWDHPMVVGVIDLLLGRSSGSASVAVLPGLERGILLEAIFVLETVAPRVSTFPVPPSDSASGGGRSSSLRRDRDFPSFRPRGRLQDRRTPLVS